MGVAAVLVGITVLMLLVGVVVNPFFFFVAVPFAGSAYLLWYQASGKLAERIHREAAAGRFSAADGRREAGPGGFGAGRRSGRFSRERARQARGNRRRARASTNGRSSTLSAAEARRVLEVQPTADESDLKAAYRQKVKTAHPDAPEGDEETFKRVERAYEALSE